LKKGGKHLAAHNYAPGKNKPNSGAAELLDETAESRENEEGLIGNKRGGKTTHFVKGSAYQSSPRPERGGPGSKERNWALKREPLSMTKNSDRHREGEKNFGYLPQRVRLLSKKREGAERPGKISIARKGLEAQGGGRPLPKT